MAELQVRLPVFVHQSRDESARDFVWRCQQDPSVFTAAVTTLADLIDMPKAEALAVLRLVSLHWGYSNPQYAITS